MHADAIPDAVLINPFLIPLSVFLLSLAALVSLRPEALVERLPYRCARVEPATWPSEVRWLIGSSTSTRGLSALVRGQRCGSRDAALAPATLWSSRRLQPCLLAAAGATSACSPRGASLAAIDDGASRRCSSAPARISLPPPRIARRPRASARATCVPSGGGGAGLPADHPAVLPVLASAVSSPSCNSLLALWESSNQPAAAAAFAYSYVKSPLAAFWQTCRDPLTPGAGGVRAPLRGPAAWRGCSFEFLAFCTALSDRPRFTHAAWPLVSG